jgi:hypothetical protein
MLAFAMKRKSVMMIAIAIANSIRMLSVGRSVREQAPQY